MTRSVPRNAPYLALHMGTFATIALVAVYAFTAAAWVTLP